MATMMSVNKLRVRVQGLDPLTAQMRAGSVLHTADLRPSGLADAAILYVRHLRGRLPTSALHQSGGVGIAYGWQQPIMNALEDAARRAARPALDSVPASAEAVLFADQAESLSCLAYDWLRGELTTHWWWQDVQRMACGCDLGEQVRRCWQAAPEDVPAALQHLSRREAASGQAFMHTWPLAEARTLLLRVTERFGLRELHLIAERLDGFTDGAPWHDLAPESAGASLTAVHSAMLGIGLMLHRMPMIVRAPTFAREVQQWLGERDHKYWLRQGHESVPFFSPATYPQNTTADVPSVASLQTQSSQPPRRAVTPPAIARNKSATIGNPFNRPPVWPQSVEGVSNQDSPADNDNASTDVDALGNSAWEQGSVPREDALGARHAAQPDTRAGEQPSVPNRHAMRSDVSAPTGGDGVVDEAVDRDVVATAFGGVFFLINLGIYLGLYADFTAPLAKGIALPIWDFVVLVARSLIGPEIEADPVWLLLTRLAGRSDDAVTSAMPGTRYEFELESVIDGSPTGLTQVSDTSSASVWIAQLMPGLQARLRLALGLSEEEDADLSSLLCRHSARVEVTLTWLNVFLRLAEHPIQIRLSGLDRDPGWVPAAGRHIAFHFD